MRFAAPEVLWLLVALPVLIAASVAAARGRRRALERFAGGPGHLARFTGQVSVQRRAVKSALRWTALALAIVALARPQAGTRLEAVTRRGVDVVMVLDTSLSMAAPDLAPSRLDHARHAIAGLLDELAGDRVALVTFAGQASLECPLTLDHAAVRLFLDAAEPQVAAVPGTALGDALRLGRTAFGAGETSGGRDRAIVLFTDGEDHEGGVDEAIAELGRSGVPVHVVGCGTTRGAPIPLAAPETGYKKDRDGNVVTTRLDEALLESLALATGGQYHRATPTETEIDAIARALRGLDERELGQVLRARYEDRFQIPLGLALALLLAESLLGDRLRPARDARAGRAA